MQGIGTLPATRDIRTESSVNPGTGRRLTALIVADDQAVAEGLGWLMRRQGMSAEWAGTGRLGIRLAEVLDPDLVVLDPQMHGGGGFGVCRYLRSRSQVPILTVVLGGDSEAVRRGSEAGATGHLAMPFTLSQVDATIRWVLSRRPEQPAVRQAVVASRVAESSLGRTLAGLGRMRGRPHGARRGALPAGA